MSANKTEQEKRSDWVEKTAAKDMALPKSKATLAKEDAAKANAKAEKK